MDVRNMEAYQDAYKTIIDALNIVSQYAHTAGKHITSKNIKAVKSMLEEIEEMTGTASEILENIKNVSEADDLDTVIDNSNELKNNLKEITDHLPDDEIREKLNKDQ